MVASDPAIVVLSAIEEKRSLADRAPLVVGIGGSVAVGKSTLAERVRDAAGRSGSQVTVIGTDGFLFPNSVLSERGLLDTKGAPNTYDEGALLDAIALLRRGSTELVVPVYSHRTFDVEVRLKLGASANVDFRAENAMGADDGRFVNFGPRVDNGRRVDRHVRD